MAVLVEAISVVVQRVAIEAKFPDGLDGFVRNAPNRTVCGDTAAIRLGFMTPADVEIYVKGLESNGLTYIANGKAQDLVVVDQLRGFLVPCDWAAFGHIQLDDAGKMRVAAVRARAAWDDPLVFPAGWDFEGSLSQRQRFVPSGDVSQKLKLLRSEPGVDVYLDTTTGQEVFVSRSGHKEARAEEPIIASGAEPIS